MRSVMTHQFSQVPKVQIQRSSFDRSHGYKTTFDSGYLIPFFIDEALPGDTFNLRCTTFARLSTPIHPFMDNLFADVFFFSIPWRLIWNNFPKFMGEQDNPGDSTSYLIPTQTSPSGGYVNGSLHDYFGLPTVGGPMVAPNTITHSSLPLRCYNLVWNQWFRDQNLQNSVTVDKGDGPDTYSNYVLLKRGKRHDYFTSCLPWPQKGPAVNIPLGGQAPVTGIAINNASTFTTGAAIPVRETGGATSYTTSGFTSGANLFLIKGDNNSASGKPQIFADLTQATAATINQLRQAFQIQRIYEKDARGGTRYTELIQAHFGVTSPDARLQRTEYLGGGSSPVNVNPIAQTAGTGTTGSTTPQGNLAAIGTMSHGNIGFTASFTEHCFVLGLICVRADLNYQQGLNRMWTRSSRFDLYWPSLAQIGEQGVLNQELYATGTASDVAVFGYQERYAEYRYKPSVITGQYRSNFATTLDSWHLAQNFASLPALNSSFIQETPPVSRVVSVPSQPQFLFDSHFSLRCARPMPLYGVPGMIDHF